jgi:flagellin-like protein
LNNIRLFKSKKAISPILATLLLIVIAVAAIIVTYAWIMTYMSGGINQGGTMLDVENIRFYGAPTDAARNRTEIVVKNIGTSDATIKRLYIGISEGDMREVSSYTNIGSGIVLAKKSVITITLSWPNNFADQWEPNVTYYFKVAPETGQAFTFTANSPAG